MRVFKILSAASLLALGLSLGACDMLEKQTAAEDTPTIETTETTGEDEVINATLLTENAPLIGNQFRIVGRYSQDANGAVRIFWGGTYFETQLRGAKLTMTFEDSGFSWMDVSVNGETHAIALEEGVKDYVIFDGEPGVYDIRVTRRPDPAAPSTVFTYYQALGELSVPAENDRKLLIIGDSISSGYGVEGENELCKYSYGTHNTAKAYSFLAADALNADVQVIAIAGRGVIRNSSSGQEDPMSLVYKRVNPVSGEWDPSLYTPDAVVVHLGTNDFFQANPAEEFVTAYDQMLLELSEDYPDAQLYMAFGPMLYGEDRENAITNIQKAKDQFNARGGAQATYIELLPAESGHRRGCDYHPGTDSQIVMAEQLVELLRSDLNWTEGGAEVITTDVEKDAPQEPVSEE